MRIERLRPYEPTFRIYEGHEKTPYGERTWGVYKNNKIEIYDAYKDKAKLIHISEIPSGKAVKFKFWYIQDGIKKVIKRVATGLPSILALILN